MFSGYLLAIFITSLLYYYNYYSSNHITGTSTTAATSIPLPEWIEKQLTTSYNTMLGNINPPGTAKGFIAASLSTYKPDYFYTWTRDAALVARVLTHVPETPLSVLQDYVEFQIHSQTTATLCNCLGEPKFNPDGTGYTGSWGRPQNDGPAERAIAFMAIAKRFHNKPDYINDTLIPSILMDLDYITDVWQEPCFDLWEEVDGVHFYTLMVMRRALLDAVDFLPMHTSYKSTAQQIQARIETFWSPHQQYIVATQQVRNGAQRTGLDISTLLAANLLASRNDGFFTPGSDKVLATAIALEDAFKGLYPLNQQLDEGLGTSIGRYPEDIYDGYDTSIGNPWFIATAAFAELYYLAIKEWKQVGVLINDMNRPFFQRVMPHFREGYYAPGSLDLESLINSTQQSANKFLATIQYHQHRNGSMSEQFDRYIGYMVGARDLTWSHAAVISAIKAKTGGVY